MTKHFRITVDGRSYDVVVEELDQGAAAADAWSATAVGPAAPLAAAAPVAAPAPAPVAAVAPAGAGAIVAPLGGVVLSIDVRLGGEVAVGDKVAIIDAMKMKTEVVSKLAGKVTNIAAKVNESVETGQVLLTVG
jgi:biotin carboxyl carrier protein